MNLNPSHLRAFLAVMKHANFTRAAEELFLTQPAVSRQIAQLQKELGVQLFEQIGKSIHMTGAGLKLRNEAERWLGDMERIAESVRAMGSPEQGRIAIGASTTPGLYLLPNILEKFCQLLPGVDLHYCVEDSRRIEQKLLRNELELGFVGAKPRDSSLLAEKIVDDRIVFFVQRNHTLAAHRILKMSHLVEHTWVIREKGAATRQLVENWMAKQTAKPTKFIELNTLEGVKALVAAGIGLSYMSERGVIEDLERQKLQVLNVQGFNLRRSIFLVRHRDKHFSPAMNELRRLAMQSGNSPKSHGLSDRARSRT